MICSNSVFMFSLVGLAFLEDGEVLQIYALKIHSRIKACPVYNWRFLVNICADIEFSDIF